MAREDIHDSVDVEKIEPKRVHIREIPDEAGAGTRKSYTVIYSLPMKVSKTWQDMFQWPDPTSGVVHQLRFEFSEDATEISITLKNEPPPEMILVLRRYAERANKWWELYREAMIKHPEDEKRILKKLRESR